MVDVALIVVVVCALFVQISAVGIDLALVVIAIDAVLVQIALVLANVFLVLVNVLLLRTGGRGLRGCTSQGCAQCESKHTTSEPPLCVHCFLPKRIWRGTTFWGNETPREQKVSPLFKSLNYLFCRDLW
jgi:hypothetical protein